MSAVFVSAALRIALVVVLEAAAFVVWNVGTRSPSQVIADVGAGFRQPAVFAVGCIRFLTGLAALVTAMLVSLPIVHHRFDFTAIGSLSLVAALAIEGLVGERIRSVRSGR